MPLNKLVNSYSDCQDMLDNLHKIVYESINHHDTEMNAEALCPSSYSFFPLSMQPNLFF